ncbi:Mur ligase domain-containing protein, partial [Klebsiella pneumoniae]
MEITLREIATILENDQTLPEQSVTDIVIDSREVSPGAVFIAIVGQQQDGHQFAKAAEAA